MAYPHDQLTDNEHVLVQQHPHWKVLLLPMTGGTLVFAVFCYLAALTASWSWHHIAWIALAVLAAVPLIRLLLMPWLRWKTTHFVVTTDKIMFREGVLKRAGINIPLRRIASVRYEHDLNDRVFGCGTLIIEALSDEPLVFTDIPAVEHVHTLLYQAVDGNADRFMFLAN